MINGEENSILDHIKRELDISDNASVSWEVPISEGLPFKADLVIEDYSKKYIIEIKSRLTIDSIGRQLVLKKLLQNSESRNKYAEFVIASKLISPETEKIAHSCDIRIIALPYRSNITENEKSDVRRIEKISSPKSWKIVIALLTEKESSIRHIALKAEVSYGWAHATVKSLIAKGIVVEVNNYIKLQDIPKLLNGIAWERPFEKLYYNEVVLPDNDAMSAARTITRMCDKQDIDCGFTSFTAGGIYTKYGFRHDTVYVYVRKDRLDPFLKSFDASDIQGIKIRVYKPDRDVFSDTRITEEIRLVSPAQALLDLAGLGYSGRDLTLKLVENYARL
ncbi:MAG: hypothetical protein Q7V05_04950 [Methanoregula sp.]|nr:hypothetical protein [Methanoregula sp.]